MRAIDRRAFLALGLGAIAWSCGGRKPSEPVPTPSAFSLQPTTPQLWKGDTRLAFALFRGSRPIAPDGVTVRVGTQQSGPSTPIEATKQQIQYGLGGEAEPTDVISIYVFRHEFTPGIWAAEAHWGSNVAGSYVQVVEETAMPLVGGRAIPVDSPTTGEARGVDPICTRTPICSGHEMTVTQALEARKPFVASFSTPRFCTSRTCGPVVDVLEKATKDAGVPFVHVEVWKDDGKAVGDVKNGLSPAYLAWKLENEPWTFFIGADGTIKDRWIGALGVEETGAAVRALSAAQPVGPPAPAGGRPTG